MRENTPAFGRLAAALVPALVAVSLCTPLSVVAQEADSTPRTVAADLLVDAVRASMVAAVDSEVPNVEEAPTGEVAAAASASVPLATRVNAARSGLVQAGRGLVFESSRAWGRTRAGLEPRIRQLGPALTSPAAIGIASATILLIVLARVLGPLGVRMRQARGAGPTADPKQAGTQSHSHNGIVVARSLVALGTPANEVSAQTGISQDLIETMRRLQAESVGRIELEAGHRT